MAKALLVENVFFILRNVAREKKEPPPETEGVCRLVERVLNGDDEGGSQVIRQYPDGTAETLAQHVRELRRRLLSDEVWRALGILHSRRWTLLSFLGITATGVAQTVEEIAERHGVRVLTIRNRLAQALRVLAAGFPRSHEDEADDAILQFIADNPQASVEERRAVRWRVREALRERLMMEWDAH